MIVWMAAAAFSAWWAGYVAETASRDADRAENRRSRIVLLERAIRWYQVATFCWLVVLVLIVAHFILTV